MIDYTIEKFQRIDILILNAGVSAHFKFEELEDITLFNRVMDTNFYGYLYPTK
jgi:NAD(P)-dependent dehydrogenase (short-subunit alcohol dehydrogenase family)